MFDDLKIRNKLVLLVAGPIVIIVLLAASAPPGSAGHRVGQP